MRSQLPQELKDVFLGATAPKIAAFPPEAENSPGSHAQVALGMQPLEAPPAPGEARGDPTGSPRAGTSAPPQQTPAKIQE